MRLSSIQQDTLFILYAIEQKGCTEPIPSMSVLKMINSSRTSLIADTNFRTSCHTLYEHKMIEKVRCGNSLKLSWSLTESGRHKGSEIFKNKTNT